MTEAASDAQGVPEEVLSSERIYSGRILNLRVDTVRLANGRQSKREIVEHRNAVAIVAFDEGGECLLVRQYRPAVGRSLLELPAGTVEPNEDPRAGAARELAEETGYRPDRLVELIGFYPAPGSSSEYLWVYLATDLVHEPREAVYDEVLDLVRLPFEKCVELVRSGEICDAKSIVGLLAVQAGWGREDQNRQSE